MLVQLELYKNSLTLIAVQYTKIYMLRTLSYCNNLATLKHSMWNDQQSFKVHTYFYCDLQVTSVFKRIKTAFSYIKRKVHLKINTMHITTSMVPL